MIFQILVVHHCVMCTMKNLGPNALYMTVETTDLETLVHVKDIRQSGENLQNIELLKLDQVFGECYKGLGKLNLGIHEGEDQTHSTMMMIMRNHLYLPTILVQQDFTVWKLFVHHVVL
jgi:hypothetical protein